MRAIRAGGRSGDRGIRQFGSGEVLGPPLVQTQAIRRTWIAANRDGQKYIVARGDTLGGIANRYSVSLNRLRSANNIRGDVIHVGRELVIPTS